MTGYQDMFGIVAGALTIYAAGGISAFAIRRLKRRSAAPEGASRRKDRVAILKRFPPTGNTAFIGDSGVERGPWKRLLGPDVANYGVAQDTTTGVLARLADVHGKRFIVLIGINDLLAGAVPDETAARTGMILQRLQGPKVLLAVMPVRGRYARHNAAILRLNALLKLQDGAGSRFVDTWPALAHDGELSAALTGDGLHLNVKGYERLAALISAAGFDFGPGSLRD